MPAVLGNLIVIFILAVVIGLIVRSMWNRHKSGASHCSGDCGSCGCGCGAGRKKEI